MSETKTNSQSNAHPAEKRGVISHTFGFIFRIFGVLIFAAFISVLVEWVGMATWFSDDYQGYEHAQEMFQTELGYLNVSVKEGGMDTIAAANANHYINNAIQYVFFDSGLVQWLHDSRTVKPTDNDVVSTLKQVQAAIHDYIMAMLYTLMTFTVRVTILTLSIPIFFIFALVAFVDGLVQRDIRRFTGGHESSFVYHIAKGFAVPLVVMAWIFYLAMPVSINPNWVITPFAAMFAFAIFIATSKFKKYL